MRTPVTSPDEAFSLLQESLAGFAEGTSAYVPAFEDATGYLAARHAELSAASIPPIEVSVHPDAAARAFGPWEERGYQMFIVARAANQVLLVNAETGLFSLGSLDSHEQVHLVGFASEDALAEWVS